MSDREPSETFLIEEFKALRAEIDHHLKALVGLQIAAAGGLAAIYSFAERQGPQFHWIFPGFILLVGISALPHYFGVKKIGEYLGKTEKKFVPEGAWEGFLIRQSQEGPKWMQIFKRSPFAKLFGLSWFALMLCAILFASFKS